MAGGTGRFGPWLGWLLTLGLLLGLFVGAAPMLPPGWLPEELVSLARPLQGSNLVVLSFVICAGLVGVFAHELGHALAARWVGLGVREVVVGPWGLDLAGRRPGFFWALSSGGQVQTAAAYIADPRRVLRGMALLAAGGPIASLLLALAGLGIPAAVLRTHPGQPMGAGWGALAAVGAASALIFVVGLFPAPGSDIGALLALLRQRREGLRDVAVGVLYELSEAGRPYEEWPTEWVRLAVSVPDGSRNDGLACWMAHRWACAIEDREQAAALLERFLSAREAHPEFRAAALCLEPAYYLAHERADPVRARALFEASTGIPSTCSYLRRRVEAALLLAEGDAPAAAQQARAGLAELDRMGRPLDRWEQYDHDVLAILVQEAEQAGGGMAGSQEIQRLQRTKRGGDTDEAC